jgi:hypothetical protein
MRKSSWILLVLGIVASLHLAALRKRRDAAFRLCGVLERAVGTFSGSPQWRASGETALGDPSWLPAGRPPDEAVPFFGDVLLPAGRIEPGTDTGQRLAISGPLRCQVPRRNPGGTEDGGARWRWPRVIVPARARVWRLDRPASAASRFQAAFARRIDATFAGAPGWRGLERVVWLGDPRGLPPFLLAYYREGGLLHLLSLSGHRVAVLVLLALAALRVATGTAIRLGLWRFGHRGLREARRVLPLAASGLLWLTSQGTGPLRRTLAVAAALWCLRCRRLAVGPRQLLASTLALLALADPAQLTQIGFLVGAIASFALITLDEAAARGRGLRAAAGIALVMPLLVFPVSAFTSAQLAGLAPLQSLMLGWVWTLGLSPLAVASFAVLGPLPAAVQRLSVAPLEALWSAFVRFQQAWSAWVPTGAVRVLRPTWLELAVAELGLLWLVAALWQRLAAPLRDPEGE